MRFYVGFDPTAPEPAHGQPGPDPHRPAAPARRPHAVRPGRRRHRHDRRPEGLGGAHAQHRSTRSRTGWSRSARQIEPFLSFEGANAATMVNNYDWTASLSTIDFLRDIGKHFPVNRMLARDVVRTRLEAGISYTEFSYVLLQSMDFLNLYRDHGVTLQFGGSDQWGNITGGVELIRRADGGKAHAFATPLVTKADGTKYGKTEGGALWLDPEMMSPYAFYQFWLNVEDEKVGELLRIFTFLAPRGDRGARAADRGEAVPAGRPEGAGRAGDHAGARRRGDRARSRPRRPRCSAAATSRELDPATLAAALREAGAAEVGRATGTGDRRPARRPAWRRARARPAARSPRAAPTSTTSASTDPDHVPGRRRPARRRLAGAAPRQEELRRRRGPLSRCDRAEPGRAGSTRSSEPRPRAAARAGARATSARAPGDGVTAAEAARGVATRSGSCRTCCATSPRSTPSTSAAGHAAAPAVRRSRRPRCSARRTRRASVAMARARGRGGRPAWWSRATPGPPFADVGATGVALVAAGPTSPPTAPRRAAGARAGPSDAGAQARRAHRRHPGRRHASTTAGDDASGTASTRPGCASTSPGTYGDAAGRREGAPTSGRRTSPGWRETTGLPVVVKGVLRPDDARRCVDAGAAAVWVSNHGGRQLDQAVATADCAAGGRRRGRRRRPRCTSTGECARGRRRAGRAGPRAREAVFLGRPPLYALAADGQDGRDAAARRAGRASCVEAPAAGRVPRPVAERA